jgi:ABC-type glycerol-3-phosphate transport system substrate-binding protein
MKHTFKSLLVASAVMFLIFCQAALAKVTISFVYFGNVDEIPVLKEMTDGFSRRNPDIEIKFVPVPATTWGDYFDKLATMIAGGTIPDVVRVAIEGTQLFASKGMALPLDEFIERDKAELKEFFDDMHPNLPKVFVYKGRTYEFPYEWNNMVVYYNTKLFKENGINRPPDNWDINEFLRIAKKLTKVSQSGEVERFGYGLTNGYFWGSMPWIFSFNSNLLSDDWTKSNANDPNFVESLRWMQDLVWKHKVSPVPATMDLATFFMTGKVAMGGWGRWPVVSFKNSGFYDYDIMYWPKGKTQVSEIGIGGFPIMKGSKYPNEAWKLIKYLTTKESISLTAGKGVSIPARRSVAYDPKIMGDRPEHFKIFYDSLNNSKPVPSPPEYNQVENIWLRYLGALTANEMTPEQAAAGAHKEISEVLAQRK